MDTPIAQRLGAPSCRTSGAMGEARILRVGFLDGIAGIGFENDINTGSRL